MEMDMKLPPQAKRVFKGTIFDTYQWELELYDGSTATFEMLKRANTVCVIPTQGDRIFVSDEEQPAKPRFMTVFGGRQEESEEPLDAAKRELLEEAGLISNDWDVFLITGPYTKMDWTIYYYIARNCIKTGEQNLDPGEKIQVKEISFEEFIDMIVSGGFTAKELALEILKTTYKNPEALESFRHRLFGTT